MRNLIFWLLSCFLLTLLIGLIFGSSQQVLRQSANDPQVQMAEDMALLLSTGKNPVDVIPKDTIDTSRSLSPFLIIYDKNGKILASNAQFKDAADTPPQGVFNFDRDFSTRDLVALKKELGGEDSPKEKILTWQPAHDLRIASVLVKYKDGYVLAGRSLRETEERTHRLFEMVALAWIIGIGAICGAFFLASRSKK